jgi:hypothetical protein
MGLLKQNIQEIVQYPSLNNDLNVVDAMVPGHFFPHHPPNKAMGPLGNVDDVFTPAFFFVAGLLVLLFWRIPSI